jgi:M6 family metalloprotease-like protein
MQSMKRTLLFAIILVGCTYAIVTGGPRWNYPQKLVQPDGSVVHCFVSGDEFNSWLHDKNNYTILQHPTTGYFVYALLEEGKVVSSSYVVGKTDPALIGLTKGIRESPVIMEERRTQALSKMGRAAVKVPGTGFLNNIVIFVRFADEHQSVFPDSIARYERMFNSSTPGANSQFNYFHESSYGAFTTTTSFYPISTDSVLSYQDARVRNYYVPYNSVTNPIGYGNLTDRISREELLLKNAIDAVRSQIPPGLNLDANGDGNVDNVCLVLSGDLGPWAAITWPHQMFYSQTLMINGIRVSSYNVQVRTELFLPDGGIYSLAHEMLHSLGVPDLYHYSFDGLEPAVYWDIMDGTVDPPVHMSAYMKWKYGGWIDSLPMISTPGTYSLSPLASAMNNGYRIPSPNSSNEFFVVEYRKRIGTFEASLPGEGLVIYRINTTRVGNDKGPPDEVYVYRPDGTRTTNGIIKSAALSSNSGRTSISDWTNPSSFLTDGSLGGLDISNVGSLGDSISFLLNGNAAVSLIALDRTFVRAGLDSVRVTAAVRNPFGQSVVVSAIVTNGVGAMQDSVQLMNDGLHGDGAAGDSIWGEFIHAPLQADVFGVHLQTDDVIAGTSRRISHAARFTTAGPLKADSVDFALFEEGAYCLVQPYVRNLGNTFTLRGGTVTLSSDDPWITEITPKPHVVPLPDGLLPAGGSVATTGYLMIMYNPAIYPGRFNLKLSASIQGLSAWTDSAQVITGVAKNDPLPTVFSLSQNYPNPFNPSTTINYALPQRSRVTLTVFNTLGQQVVTLVNSEMEAGNHDVRFDATGLASGVYLYRLQAGEYVQSKKLIVLK